VSWRYVLATYDADDGPNAVTSVPLSSTVLRWPYDTSARSQPLCSRPCAARWWLRRDAVMVAWHFAGGEYERSGRLSSAVRHGAARLAYAPSALVRVAP
jgi:hypothetical protein